MKKIILMYDFFSEHGGIERIMLCQARALKKAGYDVSFAFAYVDEKLKEERLEDFKVIEYSKFPIKNETLQISLGLFVKKSLSNFKDVDLVICHSFPASYFALRLKKKFGIPYILYMHHPPQFLYSADLEWAKNSFKRKFSFAIGKIFRPLLREFDRYCVNNASGWFTVGKNIHRIIKETYGIDAKVIYSAVDNMVFKIIKSSIKELSKYSINKDYIFGSGRIINQKRFDYLVEAFSELNNENLQLVFAGKYDKEEKKKLIKIIEERKIKDVLFLGPVPLNDLIKMYNLAKVTVVTCPKEWFGLVPLEAMACGCPVVAWKDNSGPEETIINGETGFLAEPYDIHNLSEKIKRAIQKKWNKKSIRKKISKFYEENGNKIFVREVEKFI